MTETAKENNTYFKIKQGDEAVVITGKDKGKTAKVQFVSRKKDRIQLEGVNLVKKHRKPTMENRVGEVVEIPAPIHISNVMIYCPSCKTGVKIKVERENGKKKRFCRKCNHAFDKK